MPQASAPPSKRTTIPFAEFARDLAGILERLAAQGEPVVVERNGTRYHVAVAPAADPADQPLTKDDPLWKLVGSVTDAAPADASKKHAYLAEAYTPQP
ncbi:MAG: hypothetical protein CL878_14450 [Dehalococcoidia bacterium]|nr:hypothetical protein [Dehalococcoidia bacterium]